MDILASSTAALESGYADASGIIVLAVGAVIGAAAALVGVGYGWRIFVKRVSGKKF